MIELYNEKEDCTGCSACMSSCPKQAIYMMPDEEGFLYPTINEKSCINCGKCIQVCPLKYEFKNNDNFNDPFVFAVKHKNEFIRMKSTSGGMFTALSDFILNQNGCVYGAKFDNDFYVSHGRAETPEQRDEFKGSKYIQSDLRNIFVNVFEDLRNNQHVLFSGTPCQTAGLYNYLSGKVACDKLYLCDIICHSAPSPLMWQEHIKLIHIIKKKKLSKYYCRSKVKGWRGHNEKCYFEDGSSDYTSKLSQNHTDLFNSLLICRPSCYKCMFSGSNRPSDITIGDFWGIENCNSKFNDNKGISLVLVNSPKGRKIFDNITNEIDYFESNIIDAFKSNHNRPAKINPQRERFWQEYKEKGYIYILNKYANYSTTGKIKWEAKNIARRLMVLLGLRN